MRGRAEEEWELAEAGPQPPQQNGVGPCDCSAGGQGSSSLTAEMREEPRAPPWPEHTPPPPPPPPPSPHSSVLPPEDAGDPAAWQRLGPGPGLGFCWAKLSPGGCRRESSLPLLPDLGGWEKLWPWPWGCWWEGVSPVHTGWPLSPLPGPLRSAQAAAVWGPSTLCSSPDLPGTPPPDKPSALLGRPPALLPTAWPPHPPSAFSSASPFLVTGPGAGRGQGGSLASL